MNEFKTHTHIYTQNTQVSRHQGWKSCVENGRKNWYFEQPETVWWLDLTDPDPRILREIYATASTKFAVYPQLLLYSQVFQHWRGRRLYRCSWWMSTTTHRGSVTPTMTHVSPRIDLRATLLHDRRPATATPAGTPISGTHRQPICSTMWLLLLLLLLLSEYY